MAGRKGGMGIFMEIRESGDKTEMEGEKMERRKERRQIFQISGRNIS